MSRRVRRREGITRWGWRRRRASRAIAGRWPRRHVDTGGRRGRRWSAGATARAGKDGGAQAGLHVRLFAFTGILALLFASLLGRLGQVQFGDGSDQLAVVAETREILTPAVRGRILDRHGVPLVDNASQTVVTIDRSVLTTAPDQGRALVTRVARALDEPAATLWDRTRLCGTEGAAPPPACWGGSAYVPVPVATGVDARAALALVEDPERYPGVAVEATPVRHHPAPKGANAAHLLGYLTRATAEDVQDTASGITDQDLVGRAGLEQQYDEVLRGTPGRRVVTVDARGLVTGEVSRVEPVPGRDLRTTIDASVQAATEDALADALRGARTRGWKADSGAAVVIDTTDGGVVAMASAPTFDPDVWTGGISQRDYDRLTDERAGTPLVSRATSSLFPPASTFKVISLPAAVAAGHSLDGRYDCASSYRIGDRLFRNYESRAHGVISLHRAMEISCDTVFYAFAHEEWREQGGLAGDDDGDVFITAAREAGLGSETGVDLPGEVSGRVPDRSWKRATWEATKEDTCRRARTGYPEVEDAARATYLKALAKENCTSGFQFRAGDEANLSIGQGDLGATPLQMAQVFASIATGGDVRTPHVGQAVVAADGSRAPALEASTRPGMSMSPATLAYLRRSLRAVVTNGTARAAFAGLSTDWPVAGKTGTGEVFGHEDTAWFASYAPADDPRYVVVVTIAQGGTGGETAAPAARRIHEALRRSAS